MVYHWILLDQMSFVPTTPVPDLIFPRSSCYRPSVWACHYNRNGWKVFFCRPGDNKFIKQPFLHTQVGQCFVWDPKSQISNQRQSVLLKSEYCLMFESDPETKAWPHHENLFSSQWLISTPVLATSFI